MESGQKWDRNINSDLQFQVNHSTSPQQPKRSIKPSLLQYKYCFDSSKSCCNALSMYKGRSMLIIFKIGDYCFLFAFPRQYRRTKPQMVCLVDPGASFDTPDTHGCASAVIWNRFKPFLLQWQSIMHVTLDFCPDQSSKEGIECTIAK